MSRSIPYSILRAEYNVKRSRIKPGICDRYTIVYYVEDDKPCYKYFEFKTGTFENRVNTYIADYMSYGYEEKEMI